MRCNSQIRGAWLLPTFVIPFLVALSASAAFGATGAGAATGANAADDSSAAHILRLKVARGDSLYTLFQSNKVELADLNRLVKSSRLARTLRNVHAGQRLDLILSEARRVLMLRYAINGDTDLLITRSGDGYTSTKLPADETWRDSRVGAVLATTARQATPAVLAAAAAQPQPGTSTPAPVSNARAANATLAEPVTISADSITPTSTAEPTAIPPVGSLRTHSLKIAPGDSLYALFEHRGLNHLDLHQMARRTEHKAVLGKVRPGQEIEIRADAAGKVHAMTVHLDDISWVEFTETQGGFRSTRHEADLERRTSTLSGVVKSSLYESGRDAGLSDAVIMQMVSMFSWDVDFALDIHPGDRFSVVFESLYLDGRKLRDGNLLAAEFVNQGRVARGVRFEEAPGRGQFYTPGGMSMRKAFLRTPVNFTRISSRFTNRRYHPVLHRFRSHKGVDYAAPRGTPVKSAGNGRIKFSGRKRGYGNVVIVSHGDKYTTLYGHLHRISRGIKAGARVKQGQQIGTVGSTGLATGPHLHYEFRVGGVHKDPLKVTLPRAMPLDKNLHKRFNAHTQPLLAQLDELSKVQVAALGQ